MKASVGKARVVCILAVCFFLGVAGCSSPTKTETYYPAETYYPLAADRTWSYRMVVHQGNEADAPPTLTNTNKVTNLPPQRFEGIAVTPQQSDVSGQRSNRLIAVVDDGIAEVATQPDLEASPIPRRPPNYVLKEPLKVGESWQAAWQSNQFAQTTLIPMTKTVALNDGKISVPAGEFDGLLLLRIDGHGPVNGPGGLVDVRVVGEEWFKPEVGLIRGSFREEVRDYPDNATRIDLDLTESQR